MVFLFLSPLHQKSGRFARSLFCDLHLGAPFHRLGQRYFVGVFQIAADGQAVRDARDQNPHRLEQAGDIARRRFALDIRIGGQNDLVDILLADAGQQLADADILRPDALHRGDGAVQHVIAALEIAHALHGGHVARVAYHADHAVVAALIATEDVRFRNHSGIDIPSLFRVGIKTVMLQRHSQGGGSTITQQLAKNLYFTQERSFIRKAAEMFMAFRLEQTYTKDEILELYVNSIYFGDGYYCVRDASEGYFGKEPGEMTDYESTLLAGIPNAPSVYSLTANPDLAEQRQQYVLRQMEKYGYLDAQEANAILQNG